ncbi:MAG TPA: nucleotide exchange factor GrpE [Lentisphaeria bacterium]|nr:MAG: nucleotide exchange factor GrpE [Lentisphaerae bacterium GWF2_49_21]HBC88225.1 nucleotide exchange factor GrpE [Lentisphaeria bacterium]
MSKKNNDEKENKPAGTDEPAGTDFTSRPPENKASGSGDNPAEPEISAEDRLRQRIAELELELVGAKDKLLRAHADFENFRKRNFKDMNELRTFVKTDTIAPMLNVFDHFKLALDAAEKKPDFKVLNEGMKLILAEFQKAMDELGIDIINVPENQVFDPNLHDAAGNEASDKIEEGKVIRQWRQGYKMGDRVLRPASVVVSSGPAKQDKTAEK